MDLNILWFVLISVLFTGYFVLEGFDFGVGILSPFLGKSDQQHREIINSIGPHWDGNEVWLIAAGGAIFAAFPHWYATLFSGFYLPLFIILVSLILRGVAFEFRSKDDHPLWRSGWDWAIFLGSFVPALLWGVAFANLVQGVPIDAKMQYTGGFWNLLNPYALLGGVASLLVFIMHGAAYLALKTTGELEERSRLTAVKVWPAAAAALVAFFIFGFFTIETASKSLLVQIIAIAAVLAAGWFIRQGRSGLAFIMTTLTTVTAAASIFLVLFPNVMVSSLDPTWSLTIYNAASGEYTLSVMSIVALIFVPLVLAYQGWKYWFFRKRESGAAETLEY